MERVVTAITPINTSKSRVFINDEFAFILYKGELRRFRVTQGEPLEDAVYERICNEVIPQRAKQRMLNLVTERDRTEYQLREKLQMGEYPESVIDEVVKLAKQHGFINDRRYAENYIYSKKDKKSIREIQMDLRKRGVDPDVIDQMFENQNIVDEEASVLRILEKKYSLNEYPDYSTKQKIFAYFARKGYSFDAISSAISKYLDNQH